MKENTFDSATIQLPILPKISESSISFVRGALGAACQDRLKLDEIRKNLRSHHLNVGRCYLNVNLPVPYRKMRLPGMGYM